MKRKNAVAWAGVVGLAWGSLTMTACRGQRQDTLLTWAESPGHKWRAAVVQREYFLDGHRENAPTTYVLVEAADGAPEYANGQDFERTAVVMKPSRCGPLSLHWVEDTELEVRCEQCGLALAEAGSHVKAVGPVRVQYTGFPEQSSWEAGPK